MTTMLPPLSSQSHTILKALQDAVTKSLEKKQKLDQYAVIWQNGRPLQTGADTPETID